MTFLVLAVVDDNGRRVTQECIVAPARMSGLTQIGRPAEERFRLMVGAEKPARPSDGDAILNGEFVEVKTTGTSGRVQQNIANVRVVKYTTLVVYDEMYKRWYVVPAHRLVALACEKRRGMHGENPFESQQFKPTQFESYAVADDPKALRDAVLEAIAEAAAYPELKRAMVAALVDARRSADKSIERASAALTKHLTGQMCLPFPQEQTEQKSEPRSTGPLQLELFAQPHSVGAAREDREEAERALVADGHLRRSLLAEVAAEAQVEGLFLAVDEERRHAMRATRIGLHLASAHPDLLRHIGDAHEVERC